MSYLQPQASQYSTAPQNGNLATSNIRGEGSQKQAQKLNLGHINTAVPSGPARVVPPGPPEVIETVREKKVFRNVETLEEKNIIAEVFAKMALLIMENKRLRHRLARRQAQLGGGFA